MCLGCHEKGKAAEWHIGPHDVNNVSCASCHSQQGHPSFAYGPSGLPGNTAPTTALALGNCMNCHSQVHGSNHPSGSSLTR
jgi:hypothetical protein